MNGRWILTWLLSMIIIISFLPAAVFAGQAAELSDGATGTVQEKWIPDDGEKELPDEQAPHGVEVAAELSENDPTVAEASGSAGVELLGEDDLAGGTYDGVPWKITADHELIIGQDGQETFFDDDEIRFFNSWPWSDSAWSSTVTACRFAGTVHGNGSHYAMFSDFSALTQISLENFKTENVTSMANLFLRCSQLTTLDLSGFDTGNVTNMSGMFSQCRKLEEIKTGSLFDTRNVTTMAAMFASCNSLTSLDVSHFNTEKVTTMNQMFNSCKSLKELDVSNFTTNAVTSMAGMFGYCSSLTSLDLSNLKADSVEQLLYMFENCKSLTSLRLGNFCAAPEASLKHMFWCCESLKELDLSPLDTQNAVDMENMLYGCKSLTKLTFGSFSTKNATNLSGMFMYCISLPSIDLSGFDTGKAESMPSMFECCSSLKELDVSGFHTSKVRKFNNMFSFCDGLTTLDLSGFDTSNATDISSMFFYSSNLKELNLSSFDTSNVTNQYLIFSGCKSLDTIALGSRSVFTADPPKTKWTRIRALDGSQTTSPEITSISYYDTNYPGWYKAAEEERLSITDAVVSGLSDQTYNGNPVTVYPTVTVRGNILKEGRDYTVSYSDDLINAGTVKAVFTGMGEYTGTLTKTFMIKPAKVSVPAVRNYTYNGKTRIGVATGSGYNISGNKGTNAGTYTAKLVLKDKKNHTWSDGTSADKKIIWKINKAANKLAVKGRTASVKYSKLKKKAQTLKVSKVITRTNQGQGTLTYAKTSGNSKIVINKKTGNVTIKKGLKKGTYTVKASVKAAGGKNFKAATRTVTFKIRIY